MIIWKADGPYEVKGHVAIAVRVLGPSTVQVAEQNGSTANGFRNVHIHHPRIIGWLRIE
jgi:surface antigen